MVAIVTLFGGGRTTIKGVAEAVDYKIEQVEYDPRNRFTRFMAPNLRRTSIEVKEEPRLSFRVKQFDDEGNPSDYTQVVAEASSQNQLPESFIVEGDEVRVSGTINNSQMGAHMLWNLRTGATVTLQYQRGWFGKLFQFLVGAVILFALLALIILILMSREPILTGAVFVVAILLVAMVRYFGWRRLGRLYGRWRG